jgi:hypothetical protein
MSTFWFIAIATWACSGGLQNVVWAWAEGRETEEWTNEELTDLLTVIASTTCAVDAKAERRIWFVYAINSDGSRMALFGA